MGSERVQSLGPQPYVAHHLPLVQRRLPGVLEQATDTVSHAPVFSGKKLSAPAPDASSAPGKTAAWVTAGPSGPSGYVADAFGDGAGGEPAGPVPAGERPPRTARRTGDTGGGVGGTGAASAATATASGGGGAPWACGCDDTDSALAVAADPFEEACLTGTTRFPGVTAPAVRPVPVPAHRDT